MKKTMALLAGTFLAVSLAACGGKSKSEGTTPAPTPVEAGDAGPAAAPAPSSQNELPGNPCGTVAQAGAPAGNPCGK